MSAIPLPARQLYRLGGSHAGRRTTARPIAINSSLNGVLVCQALKTKRVPV